MGQPKKILIKGGTVFTGKQGGFIENGWVLIEGGRIAKVGSGEFKATSSEPKTVDAKGKIVLPGFINCHTHLYSTLARGLIIEASPRNFLERLENLWWRLDRALTYEDCYWSSLVGSLLSLKAGVTTIFDHHSSPYAVDGCLDAVASGMRDAGIRGSVCYEVSDRNGQDLAAEGIEENIRFARTLKGDKSNMIGCMMGLHASFTLSQPTLLKAKQAGDENRLGFHIHVAEDAIDVEDSLRRYRRRTVARLAEAGVLTERTMAIHCVHVNDYAIRQLQKTRTNVIHCPRSNLSNAVGVAPIVKMFRHGIRIGLGSDGFGANILDDAYATIFTWRLNERTPVAGSSEIELMFSINNPLIASSLLGERLGIIEPGYAGDIVVLAYDSPSPVAKNNIFWHLMSKEARAQTVIVGGKIVIEDFKSTLLDESKIFEKARVVAASLWERL